MLFFIQESDERSENCVEEKINHINVENDALKFSFSKSKGLQDGGEVHFGPWNVYSNPKYPYICPYLSLARYLFTFHQFLNSNSSLFKGSSQYERYSKLFLKTLKENKEDLQLLGINSEELGTHS